MIAESVPLEKGMAIQGTLEVARALDANRQRVYAENRESTILRDGVNVCARLALLNY